MGCDARPERKFKFDENLRLWYNAFVGISQPHFIALAKSICLRS